MCDNNVNTIPASSPERSTSCSRFLCLANAASSPDQCQVLRNALSESGPPPKLQLGSLPSTILLNGVAQGANREIVVPEF